VGPRAGLDDVEKILDPTGTGTPTPAHSYTDCALLLLLRSLTLLTIFLVCTQAVRLA
jgi:hypothetical protein